MTCKFGQLQLKRVLTSGHKEQRSQFLVSAFRKQDDDLNKIWEDVLWYVHPPAHLGSESNGKVQRKPNWKPGGG